MWLILLPLLCINLRSDGYYLPPVSINVREKWIKISWKIISLLE
jgi:hypothetical protein